MTAAESPSIALIDSPELMPPAGHYSHVARHGGLLFLSGQLPITPSGDTLASEPFEAQARQVLANVDACLRAAQARREDLISVTVSVTDIADWPTFDALYRRWLGDHRPARAVAQVAGLHYGSALEVQATAVAAIVESREARGPREEDR
ncbi:RidA family protein [Microbacterium sp. EST19A]|uniref:RidA family protein n=1 Tax=Microbacterium sp. EST19A TaxID=2862681 RepID=UPI001CBBEEB6|nr:RidA family protein [Microbacterium sp. EST19A]